MSARLSLSMCCAGCAVLAGGAVLLSLVAGSLLFPRLKSTVGGFLQTQRFWEEATARWAPPASPDKAFPALSGWRLSTGPAEIPGALGLPKPSAGRSYAGDSGTVAVHVWTPAGGGAQVPALVRGAVQRNGGVKTVWEGPSYYTFSAGGLGRGTAWEKDGWAYLAWTAGEADTNRFVLELLRANGTESPAAPPARARGREVVVVFIPMA